MLFPTTGLNSEMSFKNHRRTHRRRNGVCTDISIRNISLNQNSFFHRTSFSLQQLVMLSPPNRNNMAQSFLLMAIIIKKAVESSGKIKVGVSTKRNKLNAIRDITNSVNLFNCCLREFLS